MSAHLSTHAARPKVGPTIADLLPAFDAAGQSVRPHRPWREIDPAKVARDRALVRAAVARLPEPHRTIYLLLAGGAMSADELARRLNEPREDIARLLHEARCALVSLLDPCFRKDSDHDARP